MPTLKDGSTVEDPRLDRIYQEDWRSLNYPVTRRLRTAEAEKKPRSYTWSIDLWLDQGAEGACVGFGYAHELRARPRVVNGVTNMFAREQVYWEAQMIDYWEGGAYPGAHPYYEGTSVLAGAQVLQREGFYTSYDWALDIKQMALGVGYAGPAVIGVNWYDGMWNTDGRGFISPTGDIVGGHCLLVIGVKIVWKTGSAKAIWADVDQEKSYFTLHNSWGARWGVNGRAKISVVDMDRLLNEWGDCCFPVRTAKLSV